MNQNQKQTCCGQCPFSRKTPKDYLDTKGQNGERFIGQSIGPFMLPCHMRPEFGEFAERFLTDGALPLCAGAAKFRSNIGVGEMMPPQLGYLPADTETVFASHAELLAHHRGITLEEAEAHLEDRPPILLMVEEARSASAIHKAIPKD